MLKSAQSGSIYNASNACAFLHTPAFRSSPCHHIKTVHIALFRVPYLTRLCFVVDIGAVCHQISHEEAQFCVVNSTIFFTSTHPSTVHVQSETNFQTFWGGGYSYNIVNAMVTAWSDLIRKTMHPVYIAGHIFLFKKMQCLKRRTVQELFPQQLCFVYT